MSSLTRWGHLAILLLTLAISSHASLEGCSLYAGGNFHYTTGGKLTSGLLRYDISTSQYQDPGNVYKDAHISSFFTVGDALYYSGDIVRINDDECLSVGQYHSQAGVKGMNSGLWTSGNTLPSDANGNYSPRVLFTPWANQILMAGQIQFQMSQPNEPLQNLALYDLSSSYSPMSHTKLCPSDTKACSVIGLTSTQSRATPFLFAATVSTASPCENQVVYFANDRWNTLSFSLNSDRNHCPAVLFDSLELSGDESTLYAVLYTSSDGTLQQPAATFFLAAWDVDNLSSPARTTLLWDRNCNEDAQSVERIYPSIGSLGDSQVLVALPSSPVCIRNTAVDFRVYSQALERVEEVAMEPMEDFTQVVALEVVSEEEIYMSNSTHVSGFDGQVWHPMVADTVVTAMYYSQDQQRLIVAYHHGFESYTVAYGGPKQHASSLFTGGLYSQGTVMTIAEMTSDQYMIGGDFKYVGPSLVGAKFAALWDGTAWRPTLETNANTYLPGWKLTSSDAVGDTVFGVADGGKDMTSLPLVRWNAKNGWLFLYQRPLLVHDKIAGWDNTISTTYIDHSRNWVYFGGQFDVQLADGTVCSGAVRYSYESMEWAALPANLTRVNAFGGLNNQELLQIGGQFSYSDGWRKHHENYLILNVESNTFLDDVPSVANAIVHDFSLFPNQVKYSFLGGDFGQYGVEQLHYSSSWSLSVAGSNPLTSTVYTLSSRNEGEFLFAGGSFASALARLDIGRQEWTSLIPNGFIWNGTVLDLMLKCPNDQNQWYYDSDWDRSSLMGDFYSSEGLSCDIPIGAGPNYKCPNDLSGWAIFGLCFTVFVTVSIVSVIGFFAYQAYRQHAISRAESSVEYL